MRFVLEVDQSLEGCGELRPIRRCLRKKVGRRYLGVLPRMVLLALEAWDREDFREVLAAHPWPTDAEVERWSRR